MTRPSPGPVFIVTDPLLRVVRALTVAVACCLVLAGCNAGPLPATAGGDSEETLTPAPVPSETDRASKPLPPGVSERGIEDLDALFSAHGTQIATESYVLYSDSRVVGAATGSQPEWQRRQFSATVTNPTTYRLDVVQRNNQVNDTTPAWSNYTVYANGSARLVRIDNESGADYRILNTVWRRDQFTRVVTSRLGRILSPGPATVDWVEHDGQEYVRIRQGNASAVSNEGPPTYEATLLVTEEGLLRRARVRYRNPATQREAASIRVVTFEYRQLGSADPRRPDWLAAARTNESDR